MSNQDINEELLNSMQQVLELAAMGTSPRISIYLSKYSPEGDSIPFGVQLQAALQRTRKKLASTSISADGLPLERLQNFAKERRWDKERCGLAIFCSQNFVRIFRTSQVVSEFVHIADNFYILPLLSDLTRHPHFAILALSQNHIRLLRCTAFEAVEAHLPASMPRSVREAGAFDKPDHDLENRSAAGPAGGNGRKVRFGTGSAEEKTEEYIAQFFRIIDHEVNQLYRGDGVPLILAAVDRESALYRKISCYPHLLQGSIHGSPEHVSDAKLHRSGLKVLGAEGAVEEARLFEQFIEAQSHGRTLTDTPSIFTSARLGQIHLLFLSGRKRTTDEDESLNLLALETLSQGGHVATFTHQDLPSRAAVAAILRYPALDVAALPRQRIVSSKGG
jgi:hypothetical protein